MDFNNTEEIGNLEHANIRKSKRKIEKSKLPKSAFALYIKLYCNKKGNSVSKFYSNNLVEAAKSWLTLSESEKQQFYIKHKECQEKYQQRFVNCIQKAEPFMKRKHPQRAQQEINTDQNVEQEVDNNVNNPDAVDTIQDSNINEIETKVDWDDEMDMEDNNMEQLLIDSLVIDSQEQLEPSRISYPEPIPPNLKTGKELFEMIKTMDKGNESPWTTLSHKEKHYYNQAVLTLKRDYIQKYRHYLESLTLKELFDYYNMNFK